MEITTEEICDARFNRISEMMGELREWWTLSDEESRLIDGIIARMDRYRSFLDEQ